MPAVVMSSDLHDTETDAHPRRLGWVPSVAGATSIGEEMVESLIGATFTSRAMTAIGPWVITAGLLVILQLRRAGHQFKGVT